MDSNPFFMILVGESSSELASLAGEWNEEELAAGDTLSWLDCALGFPTSINEREREHACA